MKIEVGKIVENIGGLNKWAHRCHECSLAIVRSGLLPHGARVARGRHKRITSQHSWVVIGNPYKPKMIIDGTLWSFINEQPKLFVIRRKSEDYMPKGAGSIFPHGPPSEPENDIIALTTPLSSRARQFLEECSPNGLDIHGWLDLANSPVEDWPSAEIFSAMYQDERLKNLIPIDVIGMLTDINPGNLYW